MTIPGISVIIPTYNRADCVGEAIESVLSQTCHPLDVIVVDDGSTNNTSEVIASVGEHVRYIRQQNRGVSAARNRGISASRGEWLVFLDSDDIWLPDMLEKHLQAVNTWPRITAHSVNMEIHRASSGKTDLFSFRRLAEKIKKGTTLARPLSRLGHSS